MSNGKLLVVSSVTSGVQANLMLDYTYLQSQISGNPARNLVAITVSASALGVICSGQQQIPNSASEFSVCDSTLFRSGKCLTVSCLGSRENIGLLTTSTISADIRFCTGTDDAADCAPTHDSASIGVTAGSVSPQPSGDIGTLTASSTNSASKSFISSSISLSATSAFLAPAPNPNLTKPNDNPKSVITSEILVSPETSASSSEGSNLGQSASPFTNTLPDSRPSLLLIGTISAVIFVIVGATFAVVMIRTRRAKFEREIDESLFENVQPNSLPPAVPPKDDLPASPDAVSRGAAMYAIGRTDATESLSSPIGAESDMNQTQQYQYNMALAQQQQQYYAQQMQFAQTAYQPRERLGSMGSPTNSPPGQFPGYYDQSGIYHFFTT